MWFMIAEIIWCPMNKESLLSSGGFFAAILTTSCCALPFFLFSLGVSGAWVGKLRVLEPYSNYFLVMAIGFVLTGFYVGHKKRKDARCNTDGYCATSGADKLRTVLLWLSLGLISLALFWPKIVEYFFGSSL